MDYKKTTAPNDTVNRDPMSLCEETGNIYESVVIIGKRANQISADIKQELSKKLSEFASTQDNLDEVFENREQTSTAKSTIAILARTLPCSTNRRPSR